VSFLRRVFVDHFGLKLLSMLLAVLIHMAVQRDSVREVDIEVAVTVSRVPQDKVFVGDLPDVLRVRLRGRWSSLRDLLYDRSARVTCDLSGARDGDRFVFDAAFVEAQLGARDARVLRVQPAAMAIELDALRTRTVPVEVATTGQPAPGFRVGPDNLTVEPNVVTVSGPASILSRVDRVRAAPVDLDNADSDLRVQVRLSRPLGPHVTLSADEVSVQVRLEETVITQVIEDVPVTVRGCPADRHCALEADRVRLEVRGKVRRVRAFATAPPAPSVLADVATPIAAGRREVRLRTPEVNGVRITATPSRTRFSVLSEVPAP
jgi:YbbR domain-containing protein